METGKISKYIIRKSFILSASAIKFGIVSILFFSACKHTPKNEADTIIQSDVIVTRPLKKDTSVFKEYQGITQFTQHIQVRAQSTGIISESLVSIGSRIEKNKPLLIIKSREASILNSSVQQDNVLLNMADTVFSFSSGIINQVLVQQGDFVHEGDLLASCVVENSMRILVSVPLEENFTIFKNKTCSIFLPDGRTIKGIVGTSMPIANINDQTNQFLVNPLSGNSLSENMHVRVRIKIQDIMNGIFVPRTSVYSNEELTDQWILKVIHDSIAVKLPVTTGIEIDSLIQIIHSPLLLTDQIIFKGGYGLSDSAFVKIIRPITDEEK